MNINELFDKKPIFETNRLVIRKLEIQDAEDYFYVLSDLETIKHTRWELFQSIEDSTLYLKNLEQKYQLRQAFHWGIVDKDSNKIIGRIAFVNVDVDNDKTEIGYVVSREYWNKGIVFEAARELIKFGFEELGLNRIEARCNEDNVGSERIMQKIGMEFEGLLREQLKMKGEYKTQKFYSIIRSDFVGSVPRSGT
ncbi:ribosomal-protein-alanine N-acetyltransferase [Paenibacillus sp. DS2015]|uniref:GNAT family N-acetyltransferase n=1 Tax=Paenibacillus sp. DS2015 TaxID=3373917 RepID=UPI003D1CA740